ncbi:MAG TPA: hypothetical protein VF982_09645 [Anaerolineales bacterium]
MRNQVWRLVRSMLMAALAMGLAAGGAALVLWALYQTLSGALGSAPAACLTGVATLLTAGVLVWIADYNVR